MKVVRIIARLNVGGPAKHVIWLTAGLQSNECECLLVAGKVPSGEDDMSYFATELAVTPVYIPEMSREISAKDFLSVWKIYKLLVREKPDIVHTHTAKAGTLGRIAALMYRWSAITALVGRPRQLKVVHTYHGHIFHSYYGKLKTRVFLLIEKSLARLGTNRIVVVSKRQHEEIHKTFGVGRASQFVVIPLGLDLQQFAAWRNRRQSFRDELRVKPEDILVGIVGRLTEIKNHELFLRAISVFKANRTEGSAQTVRFIVIGDGGLRSKLETLAHELQLTNDIVFAGNRKDPENFYPALDIVALTSRNEGTPLTLIEAMANARPVIATSVGGVADLLGERIVAPEPAPYLICERGISAPPADVKAFAAALARLIDDADLRRQLGESGLRFVEQNYSKERLLNDVRGLYLELMQLEPTAVGVRSSKRRIESRI